MLAAPTSNSSAAGASPAIVFGNAHQVPIDGTRVAFELDPVPGGTRVTVRETATGPFCLALA